MLPWPSLRSARSHLLDLVFPPRCALCEGLLADDAHGAHFCAACRRELMVEGEFRCRRCAGRVSQFVAENLPDCPLCHDTDFHFDAIATLGSYGGRLRQAVLATKRPAGDALAVALADLLYERQQAWLVEQGVDVVVGVPMHWRRRAMRGVNGADRLARRLATHLGVDCLEGGLRRCRATRLQGSLPPKERFRNVRDAFAPGKDRRLHACRALLVDDIMTTGATCSAAASALQAGGAAYVAVCVLARAQGEN